MGVDKAAKGEKAAKAGKSAKAGVEGKAVKSAKGKGAKSGKDANPSTPPLTVETTFSTPNPAIYQRKTADPNPTYSPTASPIKGPIRRSLFSKFLQDVVHFIF